MWTKSEPISTNIVDVVIVVVVLVLVSNEMLAVSSVVVITGVGAYRALVVYSSVYMNH